MNKLDEYGNYICHCGIDSSRFKTCLDDGTVVEPTIESDWSGFYYCNHCGAIFNLEVLETQLKKDRVAFDRWCENLAINKN